MAIPGLHINPSATHLRHSSSLHNKLEDDADQPTVPQVHLDALAQIFVQHNAHLTFGVHLLHRHSTLGADYVNVGSYETELSGYWTKPVNLHNLNVNDIHGHIFALADDGCFTPYEFRTGKPPKMNGIGPEFLNDVSTYLQSNELTSLLGLETLDVGSDEQNFEFVLGGGMGTVMLAESKAGPDIGSYCTTGWTFYSNEHGSGSQTVTRHSPTKDGRHFTEVITTGKKGVEAIHAALLDAGVYG